jgi:ComF family protein
MTLLKNLIDLIYPPRCHICGYFFRNGDGNTGLICRSCLDEFTKIGSPLCPVCGRPFGSISEEDHLCEECLRKRPYYDALGAPYLYEGRIMDGIHQLKYSGKTQLADSLGMLLASFAKNWLPRIDEGIIMPVPLHPKRLMQRKFNQSLLLARSINPHLGLNLDYLTLRRTRDTLPQTALKRDERRKNVRKAFELNGKPDLSNKTVLLIDDVATTGSTVNECARVLKKAGVKEVYALVVARTVKG